MMTGPDMMRVREESRPAAHAPLRARRGALLARGLALVLCAALGAWFAWLIISH